MDTHLISDLMSLHFCCNIQMFVVKKHEHMDPSPPCVSGLGWWLCVGDTSVLERIGAQYKQGVPTKASR